MKIILTMIAANIATALFCIGGIYLMTKGYSAPGWMLLIAAIIGARSIKTKEQSK